MVDEEEKEGRGLGFVCPCPSCTGTQVSSLRERNIYIFRFRSYLVTDVGKVLDAKGGFMNFREA